MKELLIKGNLYKCKYFCHAPNNIFYFDEIVIFLGEDNKKSKSAIIYSLKTNSRIRVHKTYLYNIR